MHILFVCYYYGCLYMCTMFTSHSTSFVWFVFRLFLRWMEATSKLFSLTILILFEFPLHIFLFYLFEFCIILLAFFASLLNGFIEDVIFSSLTVLLFIIIYEGCLAIKCTLSEGAFYSITLWFRVIGWILWWFLIPASLYWGESFDSIDLQTKGLSMYLELSIPIL